MVANNGSNGTAGAPNLVIATEGPQWMIASSGTTDDFITPGGSSAGMAVATVTTGTYAYNMIGVNLNTYATGCSAQTFGTSDCNYSDFAYMTIQ